MLEWSEFAERFGRELAGLDRDTILIVRERDESRHYVQAMREPDRLYAEAVSNNFLDGPLLLTPADEEVLSEVGWRPPTADWSPANWWTEVPPPATPADYHRLAGMMVTALRDVQGVRRPADLVYESFHRHGSGLIELTDFGIDPADPGRVSERRSSLNGSGVVRPMTDAPVLTAPSTGDDAVHALPPRSVAGGTNGVAGVNGSGPAPMAPAPRAVAARPAPLAAPRPVPDPFDGAAELEERLGDAKQRGDQLGYFELLMQAELVLPSGPADDPGELVTTSLGDRTYVIAFTSPKAMGRSLGQGAGQFRRAPFSRLAGGWPDPQWSLAVNPGLPSEIHLDSATVARVEEMRRTAERASTVDAIVTHVRKPGGEPPRTKKPSFTAPGPSTTETRLDTRAIGDEPPMARTTSAPAPVRPERAAPQLPAPAVARAAGAGAVDGARTISVPHGARLWWHRDGGAATPVAVYDAARREWEPVSVGRRARRDH